MVAQRSTASAVAAPSQDSSPAGAQAEDVQRVARAERELHVDATEVARETSVLVLGIDDVHLNAAAERSHQECRQQVRLARARVAEHADVGVGIALLVERVDQNRRTAGAVAADDKAARLLNVGTGPWEQGHECARV